MKEGHYWIIITPEEMRQSIPDFDQPRENGPFLMIESAPGIFNVYARAAVMRMLGGFMFALDELLSLNGGVK